MRAFLGRAGCGIQSESLIFNRAIFIGCGGCSASEWLDLSVRAARKAGDAILSAYRQVLEVEIKKDGSPLTLADQNAHQSIISVLGAIGLPVVSEECDELHLDAQRYWLVDPLDGTKDFLVGNDKFTVNIALVDAQRPVLGVWCMPQRAVSFM